MLVLSWLVCRFEVVQYFGDVFPESRRDGNGTVLVEECD